ncbi:uncharacterized protein LOC128133487 [Lactuca sativa]|uniref:uncharacterized protein LOC128133487 n=1 Tax=Lactuca sativa TaxID=4236 RepID=UPI0022B062A9|nr:uncharacterized protein LOC128133487 [Lactuca sativa]
MESSFSSISLKKVFSGSLANKVFIDKCLFFKVFIKKTDDVGRGGGNGGGCGTSSGGGGGGRGRGGVREGAGGGGDKDGSCDGNDNGVDGDNGGGDSGDDVIRKGTNNITKSYYLKK